jgi:biotin carboxyl carrier protein
MTPGMRARALAFARTVLGVVASLALQVTVLAGCGGHAETPDAAPDPQVEVAVTPLAMHEFEDVIVASGRWKGVGEVALRAPAAGEVESLSPHVGDALAAGQSAGDLVTRDSRAALEGARALAHEATDDSGRAEAARALQLAQREIVRLHLKSPVGGIVVRRSVEPGALVDDGAELLALVPRGGRVFEAHVPAALVGRVRAGQAAQVADKDGAPRAAVVKSILPAIDSTDQAALVWLAPTRVDPEPALDRFASARIVVGRARRSPAVSDSALVQDDVTGERRIAIVGPDGRATWKRVTVGADEAGWAEITAPALAESTRVIVRGQRGLTEHARLAIVK